MTTKQTPTHHEIIETFLDVAHARYGSDSFGVGYLSAMLKGFGDVDPKVADVIRRELSSYLRGIQ